MREAILAARSLDCNERRLGIQTLLETDLIDELRLWISPLHFYRPAPPQGAWTCTGEPS